MSKKNETKELTTNSKKTIEFYSKHPTLNFELMNYINVNLKKKKERTKKRLPNWEPFFLCVNKI